MDGPAPSHAGEDFEDFFENTINGYAIAQPDGRIVRVNRRLAGWLGATPDALAGRAFSDFLTIGGKIYYETHLAPLLRMQGCFDEVAVELKGAGNNRLPAFINALERRDDTGQAVSIRLTVFKATDRRRYEDTLRQARQAAETVLSDERETARLREQFIAVLGHDLRNPLSAVSSGADMLLKLPVGDRALAISKMIQGSVRRMSSLIDDVMDFARGRLGSGISIERRAVALKPVLQHIVEELASAHPDRRIETDIDLPDAVECDPNRLGQLLSNLLANAITHGSADGPVRVVVATSEDRLTLSVANTGKPISPGAVERLFQPFEREDVRASRNGLGLGLYIASEIARAHGGTLTAASSEAETRFTFIMPLI